MANEQLIISCHINNLIKLDPIMQPSVKEMRKLHDNIESNVRVLRSLGINYEHFGPSLVPIILEKLPNITNQWKIRKRKLEHRRISVTN